MLMPLPLLTAVILSDIVFKGRATVNGHGSATEEEHSTCDKTTLRVRVFSPLNRERRPQPPSYEPVTWTKNNKIQPKINHSTTAT